MSSRYNLELQGEKMVLVACGWRHTIAVSSSGGLYTYGWSKYGQLGHGDFEDHLVPHKLEALEKHFISQVPLIFCFMNFDFTTVIKLRDPIMLDPHSTQKSWYPN